MVSHANRSFESYYCYCLFWKRCSHVCSHHFWDTVLLFEQLFVATLLTRQPFFIGGIDDYGQARGAAYGAMWAYVVTFGLSIILLVRDNRRQHRDGVIMRSTYQQVPMLPGLDYEVDLPSSVDEGVYTTEGVFS